MGRQAPTRVVGQGQHHQRGFHGAGGAQRVPGLRLGRADRHVEPEQVCHGARLHCVVLLGGRAVQVQIVDVGRLHAGARHGLLHGGAGAGASRVRRGHMVRIGRLAPAGQPYRAGLARHQEQRRTLAQVDAVAMGGQRIAPLRADRVERAEAGDRERAQRVHPTGDGHVGHALLQQPRGGGQRLRARRTCRGDRIGRSGRAQRQCEVLRGRAQLLLAVMEGIRPGAGGVPRAHGQFAVTDARGAGAEHDGHAGRAHAGDGGFHSGAQRNQRAVQQRVVAAAQCGREAGRQVGGRHRLAHGTEVQRRAGCVAVCNFAARRAIRAPQRSAHGVVAAAQCADDIHRVQENRHGRAPSPCSVRMVSR
ncbi:hypothetical protein D3C72_1177560 [compost metagenome]